MPSFCYISGKNTKKQACIYRLCTWKNPSGKRTPSGRGSRKGANVTPQGTPVTPSMAGALMNRGAGGANARVATPKNTSTAAGATPVKTRAEKRGRKSISVVSPAVNKPPPPGEGGRVQQQQGDASAAAHEQPPGGRKNGGRWKETKFKDHHILVHPCFTTIFPPVFFFHPCLVFSVSLTFSLKPLAI